MGVSPISKGSDPPFFIIFTDLDGTLLDHTTYGWKEAVPALDICRRRGVPVVFASSKTRAEMDVLRRRMSLSDPFISENGGGVFFPRETFSAPPPTAIETPAQECQKAQRDHGFWQWTMGLSYSDLIKGFHEIREELGWPMRGFSEMSIKEICTLTGLDKMSARLATMREFDEPFIILDQQEPDKETLSEAAARKGLRVTSGGRFYHLHGKNDKGEAMEKLLTWYRRRHRMTVSVALGDSPNDFPMLERADFAVLVRSRRKFPGLKKKISRLVITADAGPKGWNAAVLGILNKKDQRRAND